MNDIPLFSIEKLLGCWEQIEHIADGLYVSTKVFFYPNGDGKLTVTDSCSSYEEHNFTYSLVNE
jgi:hypothetical protein